MAVGGYYIDASGLDELAHDLAATAGGMRDLSAVHRKIGRRSELYVKTHWPIYGGSPKSSHAYGILQAGTKGGGGKSAWVRTSDMGKGHLIVTEFGGTSFWHKGGAGVLRALNRGHRSLDSFRVNGGGHVVYKKPRRPRGYVLWNVAYRLRTQIGGDYTDGLKRISEKHGISMDVQERGLDIEQKAWGGR